MKFQLNIFHKIIILIVIVITVTLFLYGRSHQSNIKLITSQLTSTNLDHLNFFAQQLDQNIDQLFINGYTLFRDSTIRNYSEIDHLEHLIDKNQTKINVLEKLSLQTSSTNLNHDISVYNNKNKEVLSSNSNSSYTYPLYEVHPVNTWNYVSDSELASNHGEFIMYVADSNESSLYKSMVMEVKFSSAEITKMLNEFQSQNNGNTFLYHPQSGYVTQSNTNLELVNQMLSNIDNLTDTKPISSIVTSNGNEYIVNSAWSRALQWHIIHFTPLNEFLKPLEQSRKDFIVSTIILLMLSIIVSFILFRQIHQPISMLIRAVNHIKEGLWSYRIQTKTNREFSVLNEAFNQMAMKIQNLIEQVYVEQLRAKDSQLKQLQSQINPHFLYNCLYFIKSKANIGDTESVAAMAINLGDYYRYITRFDDLETNLLEELKLLENYLTVQNLRKQRLEYINLIPESLHQIKVPRLIIQPLIENCIVHGIEKKSGIGKITVSSKLEGSRLYITVEDNGVGMTAEEITQLAQRLDEATYESTSSYGLWNVQQRLKQKYGVYSGLSFESIETGGLRVTIRMDRKEVLDATNFIS